jgi:nucleotide-binding universal stress UspA family protein
VKAAVDEARFRGASLAVVHVQDNTLAVHGSQIGALLGNRVPLPSPEHQRQRSDELTEKLNEAMRGAGGSGEALALDGEVVPTIVRTVEQQQAGLLVVGTHGRTGLSRVLLGSVAEQLLQLADCSVLVVRQQNG